MMGEISISYTWVKKVAQNTNTHFWVFQRENYYCIEKYIENYEHHIFQNLRLVYLFLLNQMISAQNGVDHVLNSFWKDKAFAKNLDLAIQSLLANYPRREYS